MECCSHLSFTVPSEDLILYRLESLISTVCHDYFLFQQRFYIPCTNITVFPVVSDTVSLLKKTNEKTVVLILLSNKNSDVLHTRSAHICQHLFLVLCLIKPGRNGQYKRFGDSLTLFRD